MASLKAAGIEGQLFDGVRENPTTREVEAGVAVAREFQPNLLIGLGGGSSMDCAKGINFLYTNGGRMQDYWGIDKATQPMLPMIAIPTTAGTGSETQSFALITDPETHVKMACGDRKASCAVAILDPQLTFTQPTKVTAVTGIDAISHAVETYVSKPRNGISLTFSHAAWRHLSANFLTVLAEPKHLAARTSMQLGACLSGLAIQNSMLGATHSLANPLTAHYGLIHGKAVGLMLPHVVRYNAAEPHIAAWYAELAAATNPPLPTADAASLAELLTSFCQSAGLPTRLRDCGAREADLPQLATDAAQQWTLNFNPRPATEQDLLALYQAAW